MISRLKITHFYSWNTCGEDTFGEDLFTLVGCPFWNLNAKELSLSKILIIAGSPFLWAVIPLQGCELFPSHSLLALGEKTPSHFLLHLKSRKLMEWRVLTHLSLQLPPYKSKGFDWIEIHKLARHTQLQINSSNYTIEIKGNIYR